MAANDSIQQRIALRILSIAFGLLFVLALAAGGIYARTSSDFEHTLTMLRDTLPYAVGPAYDTNNKEVLDFIKRTLEQHQGIDVLMVAEDGRNMLTREAVDPALLERYDMRQAIPYYPGDGLPRQIGTLHFRSADNASGWWFLVMVGLALIGIPAAIGMFLRQYLAREVVNPLQTTVAAIKAYSGAGFSELQLAPDPGMNREFRDLCQEIRLMDASLQEAQEEKRLRIVQAERFKAFKSVLHDIKNYIFKIDRPAESIRRRVDRSEHLSDDERSQLLRQCEVLENTAEQMRQNLAAAKEALRDDDTAAQLQVEVRHDRFDVLPILQRHFEDYRTLGRIEGVDVALEATVPDGGPVYVQGDSRLFSNDVANLVKNAFDAFAAAGERTSPPRITLRVVALANQVIVQVEDNGPGLPEAALRDFILERTTSSRDGWGIGLRTLREHARLMGGSAHYETNDPNGSRFSISLEAVTHG